MPGLRSEPLLGVDAALAALLDDAPPGRPTYDSEPAGSEARWLRDGLKSGSVQALKLVSADGKVAGFAAWTVTPGLGRRARLRLGPGFQTLEFLVEALDRLERPDPPEPPVVSLDLDGTGVPPEEAAHAMTPRGFLRSTSRALHRPASSRPPTAELPEGLTERALTRSDEAQMARVTHLAYAQNPLDRALIALRLDPREDAEALTRMTVDGRFGEWLPWASFGLFVEGRLVAESWVVAAPKGPLLANVAVDPVFQGRGCAARVAARSLRALGERGLAEVRLVMTEENAEALRLYRRLGFLPEGAPGRVRWVRPSALGLAPSR